MPFYEYECQACGRHHETLQKMSDAPLRTCPYCRRPRLRRLISAPVFRLKGGGWYETDFKGDKDGICVKCEGFAECSLRYVRGEPAEIVLKSRDDS